MENRQNYQWRPNDESISTRLKYDLEVDHFYRSFLSAQRKYSSKSNDFKTIKLVFSLSFNLVVLIILAVMQLIRFIKSL